MRPLLHLLILIKVGNKYTTYQVARFCRFFLILFSPWTNDTKNNHIKVIRSFLPTVEHFFEKKSCPAMYCYCKTCNKCCHDFIVRSIFTMKISHFLKCTDKTSHGQKTVCFSTNLILDLLYTFVVLWIWIMLIRIQLRHHAYADSHPNPDLNTIATVMDFSIIFKTLCKCFQCRFFSPPAPTYVYYFLFTFLMTTVILFKILMIFKIWIRKLEIS